MRRLILTLVLLAPITVPAAPTTLQLAARMAQHLEQAPVVRAEFTQEKVMAAFKKPMRTRGRLVFARDQGVIWQIDAPIKLAYVLGDNRIAEVGEDGIAQIRTARDIPGFSQVSSLFRALLGAETDTLTESFVVTTEGTLDSWRLTLVPKPGPLIQTMREIRLSGSRHVERIRLEEANGDNTTLLFRNITEDRALSPAERERFGPH